MHTPGKREVTFTRVGKGADSTVPLDACRRDCRGQQFLDYDTELDGFPGAISRRDGYCKGCVANITSIGSPPEKS